MKQHSEQDGVVNYFGQGHFFWFKGGNLYAAF